MCRFVAFVGGAIAVVSMRGAVCGMEGYGEGVHHSQSDCLDGNALCDSVVAVCCLVDCFGEKVSLGHI